MIEAVTLTRKFSEFIAVDSLSFQVNPGEIYALLGPNGSGKSTTMKMLLGLLKPTSGTARINGFDVQENIVEAKRYMGYVPEEAILPERLTGWEYINYVGDIWRVPRGAERDEEIDELLTLLDIKDASDDLIETYSKGMSRKIGLVAALIHSPKILILDEVQAGIDPRGAATIKEILNGLRAHGSTILMSTHVLEIAERMCDRIGIINDGKLIAEGTMAELRLQAKGQQSLEDIFLDLTGGPDMQRIAAFLGEDS
ncbi:ABC transporter ATP-binding protein [Candidatus Thorarchaeota archaeon]|nr:ABC transporter ATP-binding protein [Candidatus Thorarchaeota archaeon]TFG99279.1 MAG: ABC transporter ATP-binding protein [Candidatus Thorarchaeota archaeon]